MTLFSCFLNPHLFISVFKVVMKVQKLQKSATIQNCKKTFKRFMFTTTQS